mmetsp:Transcript_55841/g.88492  ORF Transcript_55841/g.88492 Transcript_55841/m.88492 type:complete len:206 (+) Transcript_55841:860-1477(+)
MFAKPETEATFRLLHDESFPATRLDLFQQLCRVSLSLHGKYRRCHGHTCSHACFHVFGLVQNIILELPCRVNVRGFFECFHFRRARSIVLHANIHRVVAHGEVQVIALQSRERKLLGCNDVDLDVLAMLLYPPSKGSIAMRLSLRTRLTVHQVLMTHRINTPFVGEVGQKRCIADVDVLGAFSRMLNKVSIFATNETDADLRHGV